MNSKSSSVLLMLYCISLSLFARDYTNDELLEFGRDALTQRAKAKGEQEKEGAFGRALEGLTDEQKIKAVFYWAIESENDPKFEMSGYYSVIYGINRNPSWVHDWSSLRKMLKEENDPRKFFVLSRMVPASTDEVRQDFVAERAHMLFADGRVAKDEGDYTQPYAHDVSLYAYTVIVGNLRALGAGFQPPPNDLTHEEQAMILAKWLKENWPGCESLEIPNDSSGHRETPRVNRVEKSGASNEQSEVSRIQSSLQSRSSAGEESYRLPWVIAGALILAILALVFKGFK